MAVAADKRIAIQGNDLLMSETENAKKLFFDALALMDSGNFPDAEVRLREALQLAPGQPSIVTNLSMVLLQQGRRAEARDCAEKAVAIDPKNVEALLVLADCHMHDDNAMAAMAAYDHVLALDPTIVEAHNNRGIVLERLGRHADALESYNRALALDAGSGNAHVNRGNALRHLGRHDEALAAYERALALAPDLVGAWLGRGNVLCDVNRPGDALAAYDRTLAFSGDLTHGWLGRGNALSKLGRYDEAMAAYEKAVALAPDLAEAWVGRGNAHCDLKQHDEALAAYDRALALRSDLAVAWLGRGNVFHDRKRFGEALTAYDRALAVDPKLAGACVGRGNALRFLKRAPEAVESYRQALTLGADAESIQFCLAALGAEPAPSASPERFIASLFDGYADNFDHDLVENLQYRTPGLLAAAIKRYTSSDALVILDLGCGTGLMGQLLRPMARRLVGVDLSSKMLEKARQREIYDELSCSDLTQFLQKQESKFDLVVAADVFVYLGDLSAVFTLVRRSLGDDGLFCFSVEAIDQGDFKLRNTLRYAHSMDYLRALAEKNRFAVQMIESQVVRRDAGANIDGYLAVMRCA